MREYERNGKPVYHSTQLGYFLECPRKFELSQEHESEDSEAAREGKLLEGYLFGFKGGEAEMKALEGRKTDKTLDPLRAEADSLRPYFQDGVPFQVIEYETDEYILTIECDFLLNDGGIIDLKRTSSIHKLWNTDPSSYYHKSHKKDYMQAFFYPYVVYKLTGKRVTFTYVVSQFDIGAVKVIPFPELSDESIGWMEKLIDEVHNTPFKIATVSENTCIKGKYGQCDYLKHCPEGLSYLTTTPIIKPEELYG